MDLEFRLYANNRSPICFMHAVKRASRGEYVGVQIEETDADWCCDCDKETK